METNHISLAGLAAKAAVTHTVTYFVAGLAASVAFGYGNLFAEPQLACYMRQIGDPWVMAGPLLQPVRGVIFATAFYAFRDTLFGSRRGWLLTWWLLVALGILSTFGPAPASVEGMIYTLVPIRSQLAGLPEVLAQSLLLSGILFYWVRNPRKRWLTWVMGALFAAVVTLLTLGLATQGRQVTSREASSVPVRVASVPGP